MPSSVIVRSLSSNRAVEFFFVLGFSVVLPVTCADMELRKVPLYPGAVSARSLARRDRRCTVLKVQSERKSIFTFFSVFPFSDI